MIKDLCTVKIKGGCFEQETELQDLLKNNINIIYGRNGSGKSTITSALAESCNFENDKDILSTPQFDVTFTPPLSNDAKKNVFVFNEDFIEKSVRIRGEGLKTIVMLGSQVDIEQKINDAEKEKKELEQAIKKLESEKDKLDENQRESLTYQQFQAIHKKLSEPSGWAERDRLIRNNKTNSKIQPKLLEELKTFKDKIQGIDIEKEKAALLKDIQNYTKASEGSIINDKYTKIFLPTSVEYLNNLLHKTIEKPELTERDETILHILSSKYNYLISAKEYILHDDTDCCPFCFQPLSSDYKEQLKVTIERHLNQESEIYKASISEEISKFKPISSAEASPTAREILNDLLKDLEIAKEKVNKFILITTDILTDRKKDIYCAFQTSIPNEVSIAFNEYNSIIDLLNQEIKNYNKIVTNREKQKEELIKRNKILAYAEYNTFIDIYFGHKRSFKNIEIDLELHLKNLETLNTNIKKFKSEQKNTSISLSIINETLSFIFFDKKRIALQASDGCYRVMVNGKNIPPSKVSVGERNAIALSYFFASIGEEKTQKNRYSTPSLIILDDPISSFDFENKVGILSVLRWQICEILKSCTESKFLIFSHDTETIFNLIKIADDITSNDSYLSEKPKVSFAQIKNRNIDYLFTKIKDKSNDRMRKWNAYRILVENVFHFASLNGEEEETDNVFPIGNTIRKMLEAYSTFVYSKGIDSMLHSPDILSKIPEEERTLFLNCMSRLILNTDSHMMESAKSLSVTENHFSFSERQKIAKTALKFLLYINEQHLAAYLSNNDIATIKGWGLI